LSTLLVRTEGAARRVRVLRRHRRRSPVCRRSGQGQGARRGPGRTAPLGPRPVPGTAVEATGQGTGGLTARASSTPPGPALATPMPAPPLRPAVAESPAPSRPPAANCPHATSPATRGITGAVRPCPRIDRSDAAD